MSSRWASKDNTNMAKVLSPFHKLLGSASKRGSQNSSSESICEKDSPRGVLEAVEDCSSTCNSVTPRRSRTSFWRRLSSVKLFFPLPRSAEDLMGKDSEICSSYTEDLKPSWRCFSYDEISRATNSFHAGGMANKQFGMISNISLIVQLTLISY